MQGAHSISVSSNPVGRSQDHASGASVKPISVHINDDDLYRYVELER
jgi:hypothetical protein